jgi:hypothetical protein
MDRRVRVRFALLVVVVAVAVGLAVAVMARTSGATAEATGVVVAVDARALGDVRSFTLRLPGGQLLDFDLRALENGTAFPPGHLAEHQATAAPVRVTYRMDGTTRLAIRLDDAPR